MEPVDEHAPTESESPGSPPEGFVVRTTTFAPSDNPDLELIRSVVLRDSMKVRKEAKYLRVTSRHTGEYHHEALTLTTTKKLKAGDKEDPKHSISLSTEDGEDEIQKLTDFVLAVRTGSVPAQTSKYLVLPTVPVADTGALVSMVQSASAAGKVNVLAEVLTRAAADGELFDALMKRAERDPEVFANAAAALNLATYSQALNELNTLIAKRDVREDEFQQLVTRNPWMFGSEYSELLDRRKWTRDEQQDFVVRRTTDGYIEMVEIKTPLNGAPLFQYDKSHDSYYAGAELSKVVGQVEKYLELLDAARDGIKSRDREDTNKIRAKVIVGRDLNAQQTEALRRFNGHLIRIEVMTFDQLHRIAARVVAHLQRAVCGEASEPPEDSVPTDDGFDGIPF